MESILNFDTILSETDSLIDREWRNMVFCAELAEQHREMEKYINECIIKASGNKKAINEMYVLNESAFTDKVKGFFEKIKNFFKTIFGKLSSSLTALFAEQKKYMDKYANVITKCIWQAGDVSDIKNRFEGLPRIIDAVDNADTAILPDFIIQNGKIDTGKDDSILEVDIFKSSDNIEKAYNNEKMKTKIEADKVRTSLYDEYTKTEYWSKINDFDKYKVTDSNNVIDSSATFRAWFDGSVDNVNWTNDEVENNFQTVINVCYGGESYLKRIDGIVQAVNKKMDEYSKVMENYLTQSENNIKQATKNANDNTNNVNKKEADAAKREEDKIANAINDASKKSEKTEKEVSTSTTPTDETKTNDQTKTDNKDKPVNAGAIITGKSYFNEMNIGNGMSSNNSNKNSNISNGTGKENMANASASKAKVQNTEVKGKDAENVETSGDVTNEVKKHADELLDISVFNIRTTISETSTFASNIARALFNSFRETNNDFFKIIRAHVQWYLSNPGADQNPENQTTRPKNLNLNAGTQQVQVKKNTTTTTTQAKNTTTANNAAQNKTNTNQTNNENQSGNAQTNNTNQTGNQ